jgi:hypothetical protein
MSEQSKDACGLTQIAAGPIERVPVRLRESTNTTAAWRLDISCDQGTGHIVQVDTSSGTFFRGDGLFLGWPQERLADLYRTVTGWNKSGPDLVLQQLG